MKERIHSLLKGSFLFNRESVKQWYFLIYIVVLVLFMVTSAHRFDKKVMEIADLNKKSKEMRALFIAIRSEAVKLKLETNVRKRVLKDELFPSENPPYLIEFTNTNKSE